MSATAVQESATVAPKKSLVSKLKIPGIIVGIVVLEWILAFFLMPGSTPSSPSAASAAATDEHESSAEAEESHEDEHAASTEHGKDSGKEGKGHGAEKGAEKGHGEAASKGPKHSDASEVDLGNFTVSGFQPASNSTLFITFHLYGTVRHKYAGEFSQRLEENQHRIRDNIIVIIRSAEITDLTDAGLGLIKRRILETTNKTLGKPLLQEVVFSEFSFIEQ
jgi:flagellar basal body-associated protein FliL